MNLRQRAVAHPIDEPDLGAEVIVVAGERVAVEEDAQRVRLYLAAGLLAPQSLGGRDHPGGGTDEAQKDDQRARVSHAAILWQSGRRSYRSVRCQVRGMSGKLGKP
jgi:hypothetical protein